MLFLSLLLALTAAPALSQQEGVATLSDDAEAQWVPFEFTSGNQIRFRMAVDGRAMTALLDTGVSHSVLARRLAEPGRIRPMPGLATAIGGTVDVGWISTRTITFGGLTRRGGGLAVAALPALATGGGTAVDMLVGRDLTGAHALDIDYAGKRFRILRSGRMPFTGAVAPLSILRNRLIYAGEVTIGRRRLRPMVVDTGDGSALTVTQAHWDAAQLHSVPTTTAVSFGLGGAVVTGLAIAPQVRTGALTARDVEVRIEPAGGFSDTIGVAGRIGSGFLQNYRVLLDPAASRMILAPNGGAAVPPVRSTSGLLVGVAGDRLRIIHVMKGGPAAADGWREGETICAVDGAPIPSDYATNPLAIWSAGVPGRVVVLRLCDGTERRLRLRAFY